MKILALESTAGTASAAVTEDKKILAVVQVGSGRTHSEILLPMAEHLLSSLHLMNNDIDMYAVTVGPGSFTGVRIGVSTVKGLAFGRNVPCVGVSSLRALAENLSACRGILCPVMDARRGQVYNALFRATDGRIERLTEDRVLPVAELVAEVLTYGEPVFLCGDGYDLTARAFTEAGRPAEPVSPLLREANAASAAKVAFDMFRDGKFTTDRALTCTYLRLPQAERERLEKEKMLKNDK